MRLSIVIFMIGLLIAGAASLLAIESPAQEQEFIESPAQEQKLYVGTEIYNFYYREPDLDVEWNGLMYGLVGVYTYRKDPHGRDNIIAKIEGRYALGQVDYDGELSTGEPVEVKDINDYTWELRGVAGQTFAFSEVTTITPYIGIGYRFLHDGFGKDEFGYDRESNYWYSPIGIQTITDLQNNWTVGMKLEYDFFWNGLQKSYLSELDETGLDDIENKQEKGYGLRGSVGIQRKGKAIDWTIEPFIRYWNIGKSRIEDVKQYGITVGEGWEPANNTTETGIEFMARF